MPAREQFDAEEFAKFAAIFTNNPTEHEAVNGARMMYREAKRDGGGRIVDLFYRADVMAALDGNLQPVREPTDAAKLAAAEAEAAELRAKLGAVLPKVTELADELRREKENAAQCSTATHGQDEGPQFAGGWFAVLAAMAAGGLIIASVFR
jgi:hypothetical protein